jgi:hypothetical protein
VVEVKDEVLAREFAGPLALTFSPAA